MLDHQIIWYNFGEGGNEEFWIGAFKYFGFHVAENPMNEGTDTYSYIISKENPSEEQFAEIMRHHYGSELEDDETMWKYLTPERRAELQDEINAEEAKLQEGAGI